MSEKYKELSGFEADDASDIGIRLKVLSSEMAKLYNQLEVFDKQLFPQTSSGEYLDLHAELRGLVRKDKTKATGTLKFSRETPAITDLPIALGTLAGTSYQNPSYFTTTKATVLKAGTTWVEVPAEAVKKGIEGNLAVGKANVLVSSTAGITSVTNIKPFSGGQNSENDETLRNRLIYSYSNPSTSLNAAYYYDLASSHESVAFAKILPKKRGKGTVDVIICGINGTNENEVISQVKAVISSSREVCVDIFVEGAIRDYTNLNIELQTLESYNFDTVAQSCKEAVTNFVNNLNIGEPLRLSYLSREILAVNGVLNYKIKVPSVDVAVLDNHVIRIGTVNISAWGG